MERVFSSESPLNRAESESTAHSAVVWAGNAIDLFKQGLDLGHQLRSPRARQALSAEVGAVIRGLLSAPSLVLARLEQDFTPWHWVDAWARKHPQLRAAADDSGEINWGELKTRAQALGVRLRQLGVTAGVPVVLFANNSNYLVVALLAIQWAGACPVVLNATCDAHLLEIALEQTGAKFMLVENPSEVESMRVDPEVRIVAGQVGSDSEPANSETPSSRHESAATDAFALLFTSGTTGQPKATSISNFRAVTSGFGMGTVCLGLDWRDSIYCVLPLSHATGLLTGLCAALLTGSALILPRRFSVDGFWQDVARQRATSIIYVGEVARHLLAAPACAEEGQHVVKCLYGTGMSIDVWHRLQARFRIPRIVELYGATELPLAMVNLPAAPGFMGRIALRHLSPWQVLRCNDDTGELLRRDSGACEPCADFEPGELVFRSRYRTGDIVVRDDFGFVQLVDRQAGFYRQRGHNVSTQAVTTILRSVLSLEAVGVTHIALPRYDGQAGLVVAVPGKGFELEHIEQAYQRLPEHERPRFLRLTASLGLNRGLKFDAIEYRNAGIDPEIVKEPLYVYGRAGLVSIDSEIWRELQLGLFRF
jgi:acyl-CoA synthetase (AMP-forming)/AMP-acid ligase II